MSDVTVYRLNPDGTRGQMLRVEPARTATEMYDEFTAAANPRTWKTSKGPLPGNPDGLDASAWVEKLIAARRYPRAVAAILRSVAGGAGFRLDLNPGLTGIEAALPSKLSPTARQAALRKLVDQGLLHREDHTVGGRAYYRYWIADPPAKEAER